MRQGDGCIGRIGGFEHQCLPAVAQPFDRGFFPQQRNDDLADLGGVLLANQHVVPVDDPRADHTVAVDLEGKMRPFTQ